MVDAADASPFPISGMTVVVVVEFRVLLFSSLGGNGGVGDVGKGMEFTKFSPSGGNVTVPLSLGTVVFVVIGVGDGLGGSTVPL